LLGIASFLVASKFEDIYPPELEEFCYLCENIYKKEQLIEFEGRILSFLKFDLIFVSSLDILEILLQEIQNSSENIQKISELILKLFLFDGSS